ncbi:HlyD family secretion protein [Desulforhopalus sp. IMCC35007]|uniref:HlyD family secretion protein n=1 Tax=Desulforhopalus sp. IMCC35007 TaxID=2569543 RepID=UPI0010AE4B69|nr:biotin/lipoyl-binding protein [Desulforhopalus sp. IMCC35007]TKB08236.1 HlyD family secretion protein [Desulforhopalus sp. IMCC35007]
METLLILTYSSVCWLIFKIFKIPVNKWSLTTVVLGGVLMMATILAGMAYYHPASVTARSYFITTPIVSNVRGKVIEVNVTPNEQLQKGDILCKIDPVPFQAQVDNITSQLDFAQKRLEESKTLAAASAGSIYDVESFEKEVKSLEAQLIAAQFNLDSTVITAPTSGFVTHLRLKPGMMAVPLPLAPIMTFVNTDEPIFVAGFGQQPMQNIKQGNHAEVIFPGIPGRIFQAHVKNILGALAEGQLSPSLAMVNVNAHIPEGLIPVFIEFDDDMSEFFLPMGSVGTVAVYSEKWHHVTIIRKMLMRMKSWQNFAKFH